MPLLYRKVRPKITFTMFLQLFVLGLLGLVSSTSVITKQTKSKTCAYITQKSSISSSCFFRPVIDQNFYYAGLKFTSPTFSCAMSNMLPAMTFVMAVICRYIYAPSITSFNYIGLIN